MKKSYSILFTLLIAGIIGVVYFLSGNQNNSKLGELLTPQQMWENQINKKREKGESDKTDKPNEFTKYFKDITSKFNSDENNYPLNYRVSEFLKAKSKSSNIKSKAATITWQQRGPANVGGRTRGLIVDPDDVTHNTWYAGAATGGIWKTIDGGSTWTCLTDDIPNLSANTIAMAESNHNIIYAGTGESFPGGTYLQGSGVFKSTDRGDTWTQLVNTANNEDFEYVNRLVIDPLNPDIVIVATEAGVLKTINGGTDWTKVYSSSTGIEDLDADPSNFNKLYATEHAVGVVKSEDAGDNWTLAINGLEQGLRYELAVSPVNTAKIYLSVNTSDKPVAYRSIDYGNTWVRFYDNDDVPDDFLGGQGEYDNIITAHPYNEDVAYLGGVNLWKIDYSNPGTPSESDPAIYRISLENTETFLSFINFGGAYLNGGMELGTENDATDLVSTDWSSVEIRFGAGMVQKAHRFTVGGVGSGVPASDYVYEDYVDVPFEVWDVTNNRQLMASFRDQAENGVYDLVKRIESDPSVGREYLFVNAVEYSETPSVNIAKNAGHSYKQLYFFWPTLAEGGTWDENNLPDSKISITYGAINEVKGTSSVVTDAYGSGDNNYNQGAGFGTTSIPGVHPDHHNFVIVPINEVTDSFLVVNANDGGLAISKNSAITFNQLPNNYITTQFYGVAKNPEANEYIGGMQDNGTWRSSAGENASSETDYLFQIGGDGFECIWHASDPNKIIGSLYNNSFKKTVNGGETWTYATSGITSDDGPFISRLSTHKNTPDNLYAVGKNGVYKSTNFGGSWQMKTIGTGWLPEGRTAVTSQHNVEVSLANENIVWAGAAMSEANGWKIFVSTDQAETFNPVADFTGADLSGYISGIATHPFEDSTAYILFSFPGESKIIRTNDLGQNWEDISGFNGASTSSNGFPDVVTHCLVVLPNDPSTIWVGTDIGLLESTDDGASWHYANNGIPAVSIYDMFVQDGQVVIATHGRGIWTASIEELSYIPELNGEYSGKQTISAIYEVSADVDSLELYSNDLYISAVTNVQAGSDTIKMSVSAEGEYQIQLKSYSGNNVYYSNFSNVVADFKPVITNLVKGNEGNTIDITAELNENYDSLQIVLNGDYVRSVTELNLGENIFSLEYTNSGTQVITLIAYISETGYESVAEDIYLTYTGFFDLSEANSLKVYPNPSEGSITIELPKSINGSFNIEVYSLSGTKVYAKTMRDDNNKIDLSNLNNGLYIISIKNGGKIYSQKIRIKK